MGRIIEDNVIAFLTKELEAECLNDIFKVIDSVIHTHFGRFVGGEHEEEFRSTALLALYELRESGKFDPSRSRNASSYAYTCCRNAIECVLRDYDNSMTVSITSVDSGGNEYIPRDVDIKMSEQSHDSLPKYVEKYIPYITGVCRGYGVAMIDDRSARSLVMYLTRLHRNANKDMIIENLIRELEYAQSILIENRR